MLEIDFPEPLMWALRWVLFLGPLFGVLLLGWRQRGNPRAMVGGVFAFLYGLAMIFTSHQIALAAGWWSYGGEVLMVMGMPSDIWIGGAILFGPVMYFAFSSARPLLVFLPIIIGLHGTLFSSLEPLVIAGSNWFAGVVLVFIIAHIPAFYLARWTALDEKLPWRAALLALGYGFLAFFVLPSIIMLAMGGSWTLTAQPAWLLGTCLALLGLCFVIGLSAVQMFAIHGEGTPIPLDPTKRLVRTGLFAYVTNPMQLSTAMSWVLIGIMLANIWVACAAVMAWVFVAGMVRWHHRHDLMQRFPKGWPLYRENVGEWLPRWRPWLPEAATLQFDPARHDRFIQWLGARSPIGLEFNTLPGAALTYKEPGEAQQFTGTAAIAKSLNHINFAWALIGAGLLLVILPLGCAVGKERPA